MIVCQVKKFSENNIGSKRNRGFILYGRIIMISVGLVKIEESGDSGDEDRNESNLERC